MKVFDSAAAVKDLQSTPGLRFSRRRERSATDFVRHGSGSASMKVFDSAAAVKDLQSTPGFFETPETTNVSIKSMLEYLLPHHTSLRNPKSDDIHSQIKNFSLCCALLSSAEASTSEMLTWIPNHLSMAANSAFREVAKAYFSELDLDKSKRVSEFRLDCSLMSDDNKLVIELMFELLPLLKDSIKASSIDKLDDGDEIAATSARVPVAYAIVAAYQFKWFVMQVAYPHMGKLCSLVIPCALTAVDHWSSEVKVCYLPTMIECQTMLDNVADATVPVNSAAMPDDALVLCGCWGSAPMGAAQILLRWGLLGFCFDGGCWVLRALSFW